MVCICKIDIFIKHLVKEGIEMEEMNFVVGDLVQVKKPHPCGSKVWEILQLGADVRLKCQGCGRIVLLPRGRFSKMMKGRLEK